MSAAARYLRASAAVGALATALAAVLAPWDGSRLPAALGAAAAAILGAGFGSWLVRAHGSPSTGVVWALAAGMVSRVAVLGGGTVMSLRHSESAAWGFFVGFALGFTALLALEIAWFVRRTPAGARARERDVRS